MSTMTEKKKKKTTEESILKFLIDGPGCGAFTGKKWPTGQ